MAEIDLQASLMSFSSQTLIKAGFDNVKIDALRKQNELEFRQKRAQADIKAQGEHAYSTEGEAN